LYIIIIVADTTVFYLTNYIIINYFINLYKLKISNNIRLLYELAENLDQLNENEYEYNLGFWEILNKYKLDKINSCNINNGYKQEFQIEQLF